ncbi:MAG: hypothetical protein QM680_02715 [Luteolibacter sp.]
MGSFAFPEGVGAGLKVLRIFPNVADCSGEVFRIADHGVPVSFLPNFTVSNFPGSEAFPAFHERFKGMAGSEKQMQVIGHDHPSVMMSTCALVVHEDFLDGLTVIGVSQKAGSHSFIEPVFQFPDETFLVFLCLGWFPRFWVVAFPSFEFFFPNADFGGWHGVSEAKCDELHRMRLLPMGKLGAVFLNFLGGIKEFAHVEILSN